jgi:hypothetical protein
VSLIVGIRCTDSLVLAASGPGTMPSEDGLPPARQWSKKLRVVAGQAVLGVTGHDGLAQEMALSLERSLAEPDERESADDVLRAKLRDALAVPVQRTVAIHRTLQGLPGFGITSNEYVVSQSLLAIPFRDSLRLFLLDPECSVTEVTDELGCATIGGAKAVADPFLAFLRKVLWDDRLPDAALGELSAYWTMLHVAETSPGALTFPIQMVVIRREAGGSIDIYERGERELSRIQQAIERGEEMIRRSLRTHPAGPEGGEPPPTVPPTGGEKPVRKRVPEVRLRLEPRDRRGGYGRR